MQYETIILWLPHRSQQSKGPALRSHVVALTQPRPCKVTSAWSRITSIYVSCQYSASGLTSNADLPLSPQVIENTHCDGICRLTRHHRAQFWSSTPAIEMQKLWCLGGGHFCFPCWILWSGNSLSAIVQPSGSCAWSARLAAELKISELVPDPPKPPERNVQATNQTREALSNNFNDFDAK